MSNPGLEQGKRDRIEPRPDSDVVPCDKELFRDVIGHFASGVTIITTRAAGKDYGVTANAVSSLSLEPPMMLVCLNRASRTQGALASSKSFAVNILSEDQGDLAVRFASGDSDKFSGIAVRYGELGNPLLDGSLAQLECGVTDELAGGTHAVYLAVVRFAERFAGSPLAYFRGSFGRLELEQKVPRDADILDPVLGRYLYEAGSFFTHG